MRTSTSVSDRTSTTSPQLSRLPRIIAAAAIACLPLTACAGVRPMPTASIKPTIKDEPTTRDRIIPPPIREAREGEDSGCYMTAHEPNVTYWPGFAITGTAVLTCSRVPQKSWFLISLPQRLPSGDWLDRADGGPHYFTDATGLVIQGTAIKDDCDPKIDQVPYKTFGSATVLIDYVLYPVEGESPASPPPICPIG